VTAPEQWLPVVGLEWVAEVSSLGNVRTVDRIVQRRNGTTYTVRGRPRRPSFTHGYAQVPFKVNGEQVQRYVHTMVLEAFVGPRPEGQEARHGVAGQSDNSVGNLSWGTHSDNNRDQVRDGTHHLASRTHCLRRHRLVAPNLASDGPHRRCLACGRAGGNISSLRRRGLPIPDIQAESDRHYAQIMGEEAAA